MSSTNTYSGVLNSGLLIFQFCSAKIAYLWTHNIKFTVKSCVLACLIVSKKLKDYLKPSIVALKDFVYPKFIPTSLLFGTSEYY